MAKTTKLHKTNQKKLLWYELLKQLFLLCLKIYHPLAHRVLRSVPKANLIVFYFDAHIHIHDNTKDSVCSIFVFYNSLVVSIYNSK